MTREITLQLGVSFRWWFRPSVALLDMAASIKPAQWQADMLALVVKYGMKVKTKVN